MARRRGPFPSEEDIDDALWLGRRGWRVLAARRPPAVDRARRSRCLGGHAPLAHRTSGYARPLASDAEGDTPRTVRPRRDHRARVRGRQESARTGPLTRRAIFRLGLDVTCGATPTEGDDRPPRPTSRG